MNTLDTNFVFFVGIRFFVLSSNITSFICIDR